MIKKCFFVLLCLTALFLSCKKQEPSDSKFTFTATLQSTNSVKLNWLAVNLAEFKNISVYRSTSPIPDPTFQTPIDGNLQVGLITDKTVTSFSDSNFSIGSSGTVYYKLVVNLNNRFLVSEQEQVTFNAFSVTLPNPFQSSGSYWSTYLSEKNFLYVANISAGIISLVDYSQKKVTAVGNFSSNSFNSNNGMYATIDNGNPELFFVLNNSEIAGYDGTTLALKYSVYTSYTVEDFKVKNGFLYVITNNGYLLTYNLSTQGLVNQVYITNNSYNNITNYGLYISNYTNQLYVKYSGQTNTYQQSTNSYVYTYKNIMLTFNLSNNIPSAQGNTNIAGLNTDTLNYNNTNNGSYSHLSVDGKYMACNQQGDVYSFIDNSTHNLHTVNNTNPYIVFSNDGKYILGKQNINPSNSSLMDLFALPGFNEVTSFHSLNTGQFFVLSNDFMDNDSLVSYNVSQSFNGSQTVNTLTVLFKKID